MTSQPTKIPTTYGNVRIGDVIDGHTVRQIDSDENGVQLGLAEDPRGSWAWGPVTPADTPVSVYR
jgi:hypothetical protein